MQITMKQATEVLGVTTWTARKMVDDGTLVDISPRKDDTSIQRHAYVFDLAAVKKVAAERKAAGLHKTNGHARVVVGTANYVPMGLAQQLTDLQRSVAACEAMLEQLTKLWVG